MTMAASEPPSSIISLRTDQTKLTSAPRRLRASRPVRFRLTRIFEGLEAYRVNGTPADCVPLGAYEWDRVDLVVSGINLTTTGRSAESPMQTLIEKLAASSVRPEEDGSDHDW
jgi:hypothetical protein